MVWNVDEVDAWLLPNDENIFFVNPAKAGVGPVAEAFLIADLRVDRGVMAGDK